MQGPKKNNTKEVIRKLITDSNVAISHSDIMADLGKSRNRVTIYRALDRLIEEGVIHRIIDVDGVSKFAACHSCQAEHHHNHIHFSCTKCQNVTCLESVVPSFSLPAGYFANEVNFMVAGVCPQCN